MHEAKHYLKQVIIENVFTPKAERAILNSFGESVDWIFDFRKVIMQASFLEAVGKEFLSRVPIANGVQLAGMESAALPLVTGVSYFLQKEGGVYVNPFYIRKSRKKEGLLQYIEGIVTNEKIILVDDIINSGNSLRKQVEILEAEGKIVSAIFVILKYRDDSSYEYFTKKNIQITSIFTLNDFTGALGVQNLHTEGPLNARQLKQEWYFKSTGANYFYVVPKSAPIIDDSLLYFGSDSGNFWCLEQSNGNVVWKYAVKFGAKGKFIFSTPAVSERYVYFGAYDGNVYALNKKDGTKKWVFKEADWIGSSPCYSKESGRIYIGIENGLWKKRGGVVALNAESGEKVWEHDIPEYTHCSPIVSEKNKIVFCGSNDGVLYALSEKNGDLIWSFQSNGPMRQAAALNVAESFVSICSFDGYCYVLNARTGVLQSKFQTNESIYSSPIFFNDSVICCSLDKCIYSFDAYTGAQRWVYATSGRVFSSPKLLENSLYIGSNDGLLYNIDPHTGKGASVFQVTERITNSVAYNTDTKVLFLPTFANEVYALKRPT